MPENLPEKTHRLLPLRPKDIVDTEPTYDAATGETVYRPVAKQSPRLLEYHGVGTTLYVSKSTMFCICFRKEGN